MNNLSNFNNDDININNPNNHTNLNNPNNLNNPYNLKNFNNDDNVDDIDDDDDVGRDDNDDGAQSSLNCYQSFKKLFFHKFSKMSWNLKKLLKLTIII